jgi:hypothetical protein
LNTYCAQIGSGFCRSVLWNQESLRFKQDLGTDSRASFIRACHGRFGPHQGRIAGARASAVVKNQAGPRAEACAETGTTSPHDHFAKVPKICCIKIKAL